MTKQYHTKMNVENVIVENNVLFKGDFFKCAILINVMSLVCREFSRCSGYVGCLFQLWPSCVYGWCLMSPHVFPICGVSCGVRAANHCSLFHDSSRDCLFGHFLFHFRRIVFGLFGLHTYQLISLWTILLTQTQQCCVWRMYIVNIYYIIWFTWFFMIKLVKMPWALAESTIYSEHYYK